jgi:hypothetical protein
MAEGIASCHQQWNALNRAPGALEQIPAFASHTDVEARILLARSHDPHGCCSPRLSSRRVL